MADARDVCWTSLHQRLKSSCRQAGNQLDAACAVRLATRVRSMPPGSAKQRAQKRVSVHLSRFGLAKLRRICVSWPSRVPLRVFRDCVHALTCQARRNGNVRGVWYASLLQPVKTRKRTFADQWRYISVAKGFRADLASVRSANWSLLPLTASKCAGSNFIGQFLCGKHEKTSCSRLRKQLLG